MYSYHRHLAELLLSPKNFIFTPPNEKQKKTEFKIIWGFFCADPRVASKRTARGAGERRGESDLGFQRPLTPTLALTALAPRATKTMPGNHPRSCHCRGDLFYRVARPATRHFCASANLGPLKKKITPLQKGAPPDPQRPCQPRARDPIPFTKGRTFDHFQKKPSPKAPEKPGPPTGA